MAIHHVELYVTDIAERTVEFTESYGFRVIGRSTDNTERTSVALRNGSITFVLTTPAHDGTQVAEYLRAHGDGVASIAVTVDDARAEYATAVGNGAESRGEPDIVDGFTVASIRGFGDVRHTFVQPGVATAGFVAPGVRAVDEPAGADIELGVIDHFAVCVQTGTLASIVNYFCSALGFSMIFEERVKVGDQGMFSQVVSDPSGSVTLTLLEPDPSGRPGQIDKFLADHGGPGVQHIAFTADNVVNSVRTLAAHGVEFLDTPASYYDLLGARLTVKAHSVDELRELNVLVDADHDGQLFQIFTRSTHPRRTLFFEIIERFGARTFGTGNIRALYEAVEREMSAAETTV